MTLALKRMLAVSALLGEICLLFGGAGVIGIDEQL
jgi:hypothetical protein